MKKQKIKTMSDEIIEEIKAMPKEQRTERQKKILKTKKLYKIFTNAGFVAAVVSSLGVLLACSGLVYSMVEHYVLNKKYKEDIDSYKTKQIVELNEKFDDGKGLSAEEYKTRFDALNKNAMENYFKEEASPEAKAEYEQFISNSEKMLSVSLLAGGVGAASYAISFVGGRGELHKTDCYLEEEFSVRAVQGKEKDS